VRIKRKKRVEWVRKIGKPKGRGGKGEADEQGTTGTWGEVDLKTQRMGS